VPDARGASTPRDTPVTFALRACDPDSALEYQPYVFLPAHGSVAFHATTGAVTDPTVTYTPEPGFCGSDGFVFYVSDGRYAWGSASVEVVCD
jgi:hypothetical protein